MTLFMGALPLSGCFLVGGFADTKMGAQRLSYDLLLTYHPVGRRVFQRLPQFDWQSKCSAHRVPRWCCHFGCYVV